MVARTVHAEVLQNVDGALIWWWPSEWIAVARGTGRMMQHPYYLMMSVAATLLRSGSTGMLQSSLIDLSIKSF